MQNAYQEFSFYLTEKEKRIFLDEHIDSPLKTLYHEQGKKSSWWVEEQKW